jgi:carbon-monoxide dehydrogenase medium subunit
VIPPEFTYAAPESLEEVFAELQGDGDVKLLAGGHSLLPLMKLRFAAPERLVDLRRVPGLTGITQDSGGFRIGAMTPHSVIENTPTLGLLSRVAGTIADPQVRHRGTIGGSLVHGDPASDFPAAVLAYEAELTVQSAGGHVRSVPAADMFQDYLTTAVGEHEVLTEIRIPGLEGYGFGYEKFNRRAEDWAMVAVCALVKIEGGTITDARVGLTNMASTPLRATLVEEALRGQPADPGIITRASQRAAEGTDPPGDLNATPEYKRHLAEVLCRRALTEAVGLSA